MGGQIVLLDGVFVVEVNNETRLRTVGGEQDRARIPGTVIIDEDQAVAQIVRDLKGPMIEAITTPPSLAIPFSACGGLSLDDLDEYGCYEDAMMECFTDSE